MRSKAIALVGLAVVSLGLLIGFAMPIHAQGVSCGTALRASDKADTADLFDTFAGNSPRTGTIGGVADACDEARNTPKVITWVIIGVGIIVGLIGIVQHDNEVDARRESASRGAAS